MNIDELKSVAGSIVAKHKGILAADESNPTIKKRFDSIGIESIEENRRRYRELLFTTDGIEQYISGVILFDETLRQSSRDGVPFRQIAIEPWDYPRHQGRQRRKDVGAVSCRQSHRGPGWFARTTRRIQAAGSKIREVARGALN